MSLPSKRVIYAIAALGIATAAVLWFTSEPAATPCAELTNASVQDERCVVAGNLLLEGHARPLPGKLTVKGNLTIRGTPLTSLPAGLVVEGHLTLYKTSIGKLPGDLQLKGNLDTYAGFGSPVILCSEIPATTVIKGARVCGN